MLDGGPARTQRPIERRTATQQQPIEISSKEVDDVLPTKQMPKNPNNPKSKGAWKAILVIAVILSVLTAGVLIGWLNRSSSSATQDIGIDKNKYQAVFLVGGQLYFGRLELVDDDYLKMRDVWYIQSSDPINIKDTATDSSGVSDNSVKLIKLGGEIHGPEDMIMFNRDQILFIENLKPDSKVVQAIKDQKLGNR